MDKDMGFDEYIEQFKTQGFKLIKDITTGETREATLRLYTPAEYGEVMMRQREGDARVSVLLSMNGKVVPFV